MNTLASAPSPPRPAKERSFAPKEHGAYGQLGVPLVAALASGRPGLASVLLTLASALAFAAHEPLLVALGHRGERLRARDGSRAKRRVCVLGAGALATGVAGLALLPHAALPWALLPPLSAVALLPWVMAGREKTLTAELLAAAALASAGVPVAVGAGVAFRVALACWVGWSLAFGAATVAVRAVSPRYRASSRRWTPAALLAFGAAIALGSVGIDPVVAAGVPLLGLGAAVFVLDPPARSLKRVGWGLIAASVASAALMVTHVR